MRLRPARRSRPRRPSSRSSTTRDPARSTSARAPTPSSRARGLASVTVNRLGASNLQLSVDYATQTALTNPATPIFDYTAISPAQTLTFNPGELSKTFQVAIADDSLAEGPENVGLVLSNPQNLTGGAAPQIGPNGPAELTINDDDVSTFSFSAPAYLVQEDAAARSRDDHRQPRRRDQHPRLRQLLDERRDRDRRGLGLHGRRRDAQFRGRRDHQDVRRRRLQRRRRRGERDREPDAHQRRDDGRHLTPQHRRQRQLQDQRSAVEPDLQRQRGRRHGDGHRDAQPRRRRRRDGRLRDRRRDRRWPAPTTPTRTAR